MVTRWVGRQDSVGPAPPFFDSGGPQTGVWSTKIEGEEFTDDMKIEFEPYKMVSIMLFAFARKN